MEQANICGIEFRTETKTQRILTTLLLLVLIFSIYLLFSDFVDLPSINTITFSGAFVLGIIASLSTCMATSGAVFLTALTNTNQNKIFASLLFNIGRLTSYVLIGIISGFVGKTIQIDYTTSVVFNILISVLMIGIALNMLKLLPPTSFFNKGQTILNKHINNRKNGMLMLGFFVVLVAVWLYTINSVVRYDTC